MRRSLLSDFAVYSDGFTPASQFSSSSIKTLYEASCWSYSCINANATEAASLGAVVQKRQSDGRWIRAEHRELQQFIDAPTGQVARGQIPGSDQFTWAQLLHQISCHLDIDGNAYLRPLLVRGGRRLWSVAPLLPNYVNIHEDSETLYADNYWSGSDKYDPNELVHIKAPSPFSFSSGHAPIQAAMRAIQIDYTADSRVRWNLENKISPGLVVSVKGFFGVTPEKREEILDFLDENYADAANDGKPLVFGEDTQLVGAPGQNTEIDYGTIVDRACSRILSVFLTPPPVVGIYDNATLSNFSTAFKLWWMIRLYPRLGVIYDAINSQLVKPIYGPEWRLWYDDAHSEIALLLLKEKAEAAKVLVDMGFPPNLAARRAGIDIEHVPELDTPLQNLALAGRNSTDTGAEG